MISSGIRSAFIEHPEFLLALSLSAPSGKRADPLESVTLTFEDEDVVLRAHRPFHPITAPKIVATKQTIASAILMLQILSERGLDYAPSLINMASEFAYLTAEKEQDTPPEIAFGLGPRSPYQPVPSLEFFKDFLKVEDNEFNLAVKKTIETFDFLENEGLAIDPAFTPEFMVLLGLLPMHFSVRTPKGDRIYREIKVNAPLWSLDILRGQKNEKKFTDVEFKFRGIAIVRRALSSMAAQYLETEERGRKSKGKPVVHRRSRPDLDDE